MCKAFRESLIPGVSVFFNLGCNVQPCLFQQFEIMNSAFSAHDGQNAETIQTHNHLGFDCMAFFFPNTMPVDDGLGVQSVVRSHPRELP